MNQVAIDSVLGGLGIAALFIQGLTIATAIGDLLLITVRLAVAIQEWRLNRIKLRAAIPEVPTEPTVNGARHVS